MSTIAYRRCVWLLALGLVACGGGGVSASDVATRVAPTYTAQECQVTATARQGYDNMTIPGVYSRFRMTQDDAYNIVQSTELLITDTGHIDVGFGAGNLLTLYGPNDPDGMDVVEWDGIQLVAMGAGAAYVTDNPGDPHCELTLTAAGATLTAVGTAYALAIRPKANELQLTVFDGRVEVSDTVGAKQTLFAGEGVFVTAGALAPSFVLPAVVTSTTVKGNLEKGLDVFGQSRAGAVPGTAGLLDVSLRSALAPPDAQPMSGVALEFAKTPQVDTVLKDYSATHSVQVPIELVDEATDFRALFSALKAKYTDLEVVLIVDPPSEVIGLVYKEALTAGFDSQRIYVVDTSTGQAHPP